LEQGDGARGGGRHRLAFELARLVDPAVELGQEAFVGLGREAFAVVVDVGGRDPLGGGEFGIAFAQFVVDACDELVGGFAFGRRGGGEAAGGGGGFRGFLAAGEGEQARGDGEREQERTCGHVVGPWGR